MRKHYLNIILILFFINYPIFAESKNMVENIPHYVWDSDSSNIGHTEIWFQDWTDYMRLFIKSVKDSSTIEKHPYAKTDFQKTYLNAKEYKNPNYIQLLGNINWTHPQNWSDGQNNDFEWLINRDQNWKYIDKRLTGSAKILNGKLYLRIRDYNDVIIDIVSQYRKYK